MQFVGDSVLSSAYRDFGDVEDYEIAVIVPSDSEVDWDSDDNDTPSITPYPTTPYTLPSPHAPYDDIIEPELARLHFRDSSPDVDTPDDLGFVDYEEEDLAPTPAPKRRLQKQPGHKDTCKSCRPRPARPRVLQTPRDFHNSRNYVPARYSVKHQQHAESQMARSRLKIPKSLCPTTRYGREARIMSCRATTNPHKQWPTPASHPPIIKTRDQSTMCETLKIVPTSDACEQIEQMTAESSVQCQAPTAESSTQYIKTRRHDVGIQAPGVRHSSVGVQNTSTMCNAMTETDVSLMYYPTVPYGQETQYNVTRSDYIDGANTIRVSLRDDAHD